ncbi:MerR family transcriptional regulator [Umezawaea sp.]|uniref:MerR family transcriptional regulator n=1 Tax=Umezawaea sp. TaxID=1955258 RepID=UPI002ED66B45
MIPDNHDEAPTLRSVAEKFDDDHYPAYTTGRAAEMLNTSAGFLRSLDEARLIEPQRSSGGHRRYSRHQLRLAARVRELVDRGTGLGAACRIVTLEDQLREARAAVEPRHPPGEPYPPLRGVPPHRPD